MTQLLAGWCDKLVRLEGRSLSEMRLVIAQLQLDVVVYPEIGMDPTGQYSSLRAHTLVA